MFTKRRLSKHRYFIYHLLRRTQRYHCPISMTIELDVTELMGRLKCRHGWISENMLAYIAKATALVIKKNPKLNDRLFHTFWGPRVVSFDHITATILCGRRNRETGEELLLPLLLRNPHDMPLSEIHQQIKALKTEPLETLPEAQKMANIRRLPAPAVKFLHYLFRSQPKIIDERSSTYSVSAILNNNMGVIATFTPILQTTFFPMNIQDRLVLVDDAPQNRKMLSITLTADHFLVDGVDMNRAGVELKRLFETPANILDEEDRESQ